MKPALAKMLVCPLDRTLLELVVWEAPEDGQEIHTGLLLNHQRRIVYPVFRGVPRMLTFKTAVGAAFWTEHGERVEREYPGFQLPDEPSKPGEADVLRTFSDEWVGYDWDGESYWSVSAADWFRCMRWVLRLDEVPLRNKLVLEVGTGIGGVADYVSRSEDCEAIGVDLGQGIDVAYSHFAANPRLHLVQASAFALPFASNLFDFVFSFGVIHHTFSTKTAFDSLSRLPKPGGRLYIWVYSHYDESRTLKRRLLMLVENVVRRGMWRLSGPAQTIALAPFIPIYMVHQYYQSIRSGGRDIPYGVREALHAARDRLTPRYVHRHTDEELSKWFSDANFDNLVVTSQRNPPPVVPVGVSSCAGVDGTRKA